MADILQKAEEAAKKLAGKIHVPSKYKADVQDLTLKMITHECYGNPK